MLTPAEHLLIVEALNMFAEEHVEDATDAAATASNLASKLMLGELVVVDDPTPVSLPQLMAALEQVPDPWTVR